jgi:hypothetical protein
MPYQIKSSVPLVLTKLHRDTLLHLCDFLDAASILNFSLTCKRLHQLINENENYWRLRYYKEFALDNWREEDWSYGTEAKRHRNNPRSHRNFLKHLNRKQPATGLMLIGVKHITDDICSTSI